MSPGARVVWIDAAGRVLGSWPEQEPPSTATAMVVVEGEPAEHHLAALAMALGEAGVDALCRVEPVVDAVVEVDLAGRVTGHLERDRLARTSLPQIVAAHWWPRLSGSVAAQADAGAAIDPAGLVAALGGRVATLTDSAIEVV